jgi:hypothetical protein
MKGAGTLGNLRNNLPTSHGGKRVPSAAQLDQALRAELVVPADLDLATPYRSLLTALTAHSADQW